LPGAKPQVTSARTAGLQYAVPFSLLYAI